MGKNSNDKNQPRGDSGKLTLVPAHKPGEREDRSVARAMLRPDVQAGATLFAYNNGQPDLTLDGLVAELTAQCEAASVRQTLRRLRRALRQQEKALSGA